MKIAAVFGQIGTQTPQVYVENMCKAQLACDWHAYEVFTVEGGAIGIVRTSEKFGKIPMFLTGKTGNILAIAGVPTKSGKLKEHLQRVVEMTSEQAELALTEMDGAYAALFWQAAEKKMHLVTDFMGFQPVYQHKEKNGIAIASEIKAFSASGLVPIEPDPAGWGGFVVFGHTVGETTQLAGVSRLRGVKLSYVPARNEFTTSIYWDWPERQQDMKVEDISLVKIVDIFREEVAAYGEYEVQDHTLLLSSGFDSRLLLCLLTEAEIPIRSLSVQQKGHFFGAEGRLGQKVARHFGLKETKYVLPLTGDEGGRKILQYMAMNEVTTPGLSLFISQVAGHVAGLTGAVWEGFAPGYTVTQVTDTCMDSFLKKKKIAFDSVHWKVASAVFTPEFVDLMQKGLLENVEKERAIYGEDDYGVMRFNFKCRALNRTGPNPLKVYANSVMPFTPGMKKEFWNYICQVPPLKIRNEDRLLFKKIFTEIYPKAADLPLCSEEGLFSIGGKDGIFVSCANFSYKIKYLYDRRHKMPFVGHLFAKRQKVKNNNESDIDDILKNNQMKNNKYINAHISMTSEEKNSIVNNKLKSLLNYFSLWNNIMRGAS